MTIYYYSSDNTTLVGYHIQGLASIFSYFILYPGKIPSENSRIYSISLKFGNIMYPTTLYESNRQFSKIPKKIMLSCFLHTKTWNEYNFNCFSVSKPDYRASE